MNANLINEIVEALKNAQETKLGQWVLVIPANGTVTAAMGRALSQIFPLKDTGEVSRSCRRILERILPKIRSRCAQANAEQLVGIGKGLSATLEESEGKSACNILFGNVDKDVRGSMRCLNLLTLLIMHTMNMKSRHASHEDEAGLAVIFLDWITSLSATRTVDNIVVAITEGNEEAAQAMEHLLLYLSTMGHPHAKAVPIVHKAQMFTIENHLNQVTRWGGPIPIYVRADKAEALQDFIDQFSRGMKTEQEDLLKLVDWFIENHEIFASQWEDMWEEILQHPRYGIRARGQDRIRFNLEPFQIKMCQYKLLQFVAEGQVWPHMTAQFWTDLGGQMLINTMDLHPEAVDIRVVCQQKDSPVPKIVDTILLFSALDCYWRIVCHKPARRVVCGGGGGHHGTRRPHDVRPHFRLLPPDRSPSELAKSLASEHLGQQPPPGHTFVRTHGRCATAEDGNPEDVTPLFEYSEADLGYSE